MKFVQTPSFKLAVYAKGNENAKKLALVLPGRLDTKDYIHMTSLVDLLANQGYYAVSFDPPFSWESPDDIKNYSTTNYLKAVNELIEFYGNRPTLLAGHSRGGAIAMLASGHKSVVALVLAMANYIKVTPPGKDQIKGDYSLEQRDVPPGTARTTERLEFHLPLTYFTDAAKYNQVETLRRFSWPKLMICGTQDKFISSAEVKEVFNSLNEPKTFLELDTEHDYRVHPEMLKAVNQAVAQFVQTSVK